MRDDYKWYSVLDYKKAHLRHRFSEPYYSLCGIGGNLWVWDDEKPHCKNCERAIGELDDKIKRTNI